MALKIRAQAITVPDLDALELGPKVDQPLEHGFSTFAAMVLVHTKVVAFLGSGEPDGRYFASWRHEMPTLAASCARSVLPDRALA